MDSKGAYRPTALDDRASESSYATIPAHHSYEPSGGGGGTGRRVGGYGGGGSGGSGGGGTSGASRSPSPFHRSDLMPSGESAITIEEDDEEGEVHWVCFDEESCGGRGRHFVACCSLSTYSAGFCLLLRALVGFLALFLAAMAVGDALREGSAFYVICGAVVSLGCCGAVLWQYFFRVSRY